MIAWNIYNSGDALRIINQFSFSFTDFAIANAYAGVENARMSAIGPKQTSAIAPHMSAFGGKADMPKNNRRRYWGVKRISLSGEMSAFHPKRAQAESCATARVREHAPRRKLHPHGRDGGNAHAHDDERAHARGHDHGDGVSDRAHDAQVFRLAKGAGTRGL